MSRVSGYPTSTFASSALLFFGSGLAATLLFSAKPLESLIGVAVACIGLSIMFWRWRQRSFASRLLQHGTALEARITRVLAGGLFQVNGGSPYRIEAQWVDPVTGEVRIFRSWNLWNDPAVFIRHEHVVVHIDPQRSDRYYMDVSFLPEFQQA
ncbi:hypothetical protein HIV01_000635 [Lysobacter arenosi]|uniref:DUF3592 domain-containing protein n=1 Tax=Lysobacter arenosi TaxID=2795387 RepID=A0ABX7RDR9_9GAMM|nr:hypothetical protein [Lysobacter arenosi]QSX75119.1 hypothetical protein HIV01_000635 [Lysobacter arenosi]